MKKWLLLMLLALITAVAFGKDKISLEDYGWSSLKSGVQRAKVLYDAQSAAIKAGTCVDYSGITSISIEISPDFKSIPLTGQDDFKGIVFNVINKSKDVPLFACINKPKSISIPKRLIDGNNFTSIPDLREGEKLIVIKDKTPWVDKRVGYSYGHFRKDILIVRDGRAKNTVIAYYNNPESDPDCSYYEVNAEVFFLRNFTLNRSAASTFKTTCIDIQGLAHVEVSGVTIKTSKSNLTGDYAIRIQDCVDVVLKDIVIDGTYSSSSKYGYGININNTWKTRMENVKGHGEWGVMGNNNMSDISLFSCEINRFDIHCYGRNVFLSNCTIDGGERGWYCGGSSIFGVIQYDRCNFTNCVPISYGNSYKTAVGADVVFNDCVFKVTKKRHSVFSSSVLETASNPRRGLSQKDFPNIELNRMKIIVPAGVKEVFLYDVGDKLPTEKRIGYLKKIKIRDLEINTENENSDVSFRVFSTPINTVNAISIDIQGLNAPGISINPEVSINNRNKVRIRGSSLKSVKDGRPNLRVKIRSSRIGK